MLISPKHDQEGNSLQRPNAEFIHNTPTKLNTIFRPLIYPLQANQKNRYISRPTKSPAPNELHF